MSKGWTFPTMIATVLGAACGGKATPTETIEGHGNGGPPGPVLVLASVGQNQLFEAACGGDDCEELRARALDGSQTVSSGGATYRITGKVSDECDASGPTDVIGVVPVAGGAAAGPDIAVFPDHTDIGLETYQAETPNLDAQARAALARIANADYAAPDRVARTISPDEITVRQVVRTNVDDDPAEDLLIAANVGDGSGEYQWSALVLVPGGDYDHATSIWTSELDAMFIDASFDLEGDGKRELLFSSEYYEGSGRGGARVSDGKLEILGQWGCGA